MDCSAWAAKVARGSHYRGAPGTDDHRFSDGLGPPKDAGPWRSGPPRHTRSIARTHESSGTLGWLASDAWVRRGSAASGCSRWSASQDWPGWRGWPGCWTRQDWPGWWDYLSPPLGWWL